MEDFLQPHMTLARMTTAPVPRRYLALWFRWLPCELARRNATPPDGALFALVARTGNAMRLTAVDAHAHRAGLMAGMTLADARARCPDLVTLPDDPAAPPCALEQLAACMTNLTPSIAVDPPDGLILDITGCAHLFGGEVPLVEQAIAVTGLTTHHALGDRPAIARALARYGNGDVQALPVRALELSDKALAGLHRAGLFTLGDLAVRPMAGLAARFGAEAVTALRAIIGETERPVSPRQPRAPIRALARFAEPIARTETMLQIIEQLLQQTAQQMEARALGGRRFVVVLERSDGVKRQLEVETGQPVRDPAPVMRLLRERIDTFADPIDPGFGFDAILLAVPRTEPLAPQQIALLGSPSTNDSVTALIDRLMTRLGPAHVRRLAPRNTHIPEAAQHLLPAMDAAPELWPPSADRPLRPLFLFDPPQPIEVISSVPDGPPLRLRWQGKVHQLSLAEGPERIAAEWWQHPQGHLSGTISLTRDYYRVEDVEGHRLWVFRHGLYDEVAQPRWYVHGLFA
jgi:protein ImuB